MNCIENPTAVNNEDVASFVKRVSLHSQRSRKVWIL